MEKTRQEIEAEVRADITRAILSLVLPPNWNSELTLKYIVNYLSTPISKEDK